MRAPALALTLVLCAGPAAGQLEVTLRGGPTLPLYEQTFRYEPSAAGIGLPGVRIRQAGAFELSGHGGLAAGVSAAWLFGRIVGIEGRLDTAVVNVEATPARFDVRVELPPPLPALATAVDVGSGRVDVERLTPLSLNLRLRTSGSVGVALSGGLSYLPRAGFRVVQPIGLGLTGLAGGQLEIATLALQADSRALDGTGGFGGNLGAALRASLGRRLGVDLEGRLFLFGARRLEWRPAEERPLSALEQALLVAALEALPQATFRPTFFQFTAGLAVTF